MCCTNGYSNILSCVLGKKWEQELSQTFNRGVLKKKSCTFTNLVAISRSRFRFFAINNVSSWCVVLFSRTEQRLFREKRENKEKHYSAVISVSYDSSFESTHNKIFRYNVTTSADASSEGLHQNGIL